MGSAQGDSQSTETPDRFELAAKVFDDAHVKIDIEGDEHGEIRWKAYGEVGRILVRVTFTIREEDENEIVRIISARNATRRERRAYQGHSEDDR